MCASTDGWTLLRVYTDRKPRPAKERGPQDWFNEIALYAVELSDAYRTNDIQGFRQSKNRIEEGRAFGDNLVKHIGHCVQDPGKGEHRSILEKIVMDQIEAMKPVKRQSSTSYGISSRKAKASKAVKLVRTGAKYVASCKYLIQYIMDNHLVTHYDVPQPMESPFEIILELADPKHAPRELMQLMITKAPQETAKRIDSWFDMPPDQQPPDQAQLHTHKLFAIICTSDESGLEALGALVPKLTQRVAEALDEKKNTLLHVLCCLKFTNATNKATHKSIIEELINKKPHAVHSMNNIKQSPYLVRMKAISPGTGGARRDKKDALDDEIALLLKRKSLSCDSHLTAMQLLFGPIATCKPQAVSRQWV